MFILWYKHTDHGIFDDFLKIAEDFRGRPEDVLMIHERI